MLDLTSVSNAQHSIHHHCVTLALFLGDEVSYTKALLILSSVLAVNYAQAQIAWQPINPINPGNSSYSTNSGSTTYQQYGNTTLGSDGSRSNRIGNHSYHSNGTSTYHQGNLGINSDGSYSHGVTDSISRDSSGRICNKIGNQIFCQ